MIPRAERKVITWIRKVKTTRHGSDAFTIEERENLRNVVRFLGRRYGSQVKLAKAIGLSASTVSHVVMRRRSVSGETALRLARIAKTTVEDLLGGRWPKKGACPHCGRTG